MNETGTFICDICGEVQPEQERTLFQGQNYCLNCLSEHTTFCTYCGARIRLDDNEGSNAVPLCQNCYEQHYTHCCHCDRLIRLDDAYYEDEDSEEAFCYDCFVRYGRREGIHDYYFKPDPIFYGVGPRYMGVELEIDEGGEDNANARDILRLANRDDLERAYAKHDGSLDDGFEIVTHPLSLEYHLNEFPWAEIAHKAVQMGYRSHQAGTCGLHVHVSRLAFGETEEQQDQCIARILYFFEKNWDELLRFSRRTQRQLDQWAARYGYRDQPQEILERAKNGNLGRYTCVNLTPAETIEFRIFRGTLKVNTILATLQLVNRICDVAVNLTDKEVKDLSWSDFAAGCREPELIQYLKERRLYVNEPVDAEAEV